MKIEKPRIPSYLEEQTEFHKMVEEEPYLQGLSFKNCLITEPELPCLHLDGIVFENVCFEDCNFLNIDMIDVIFENCEFNNVVFSDGAIHRTIFKTCRAMGTQFIDCVLHNIQYIEYSYFFIKERIQKSLTGIIVIRKSTP